MLFAIGKQQIDDYLFINNANFFQKKTFQAKILGKYSISSLLQRIGKG